MPPQLSMQHRAQASWRLREGQTSAPPGTPPPMRVRSAAARQQVRRKLGGNQHHLGTLPFCDEFKLRNGQRSVDRVPGRALTDSYTNSTRRYASLPVQPNHNHHAGDVALSTPESLQKFGTEPSFVVSSFFQRWEGYHMRVYR